MSSVSSTLESIASGGKALENNEAGAREGLIELGRALIAQLEIPSEFIQRSFWAQVRKYSYNALLFFASLVFANRMSLSRPCPQ